MIQELKDKAGVKGKFAVECFDKDGNLKWTRDLPNGITDEGIAYLLDTAFDGNTAQTTWYIGLIDNASFSALDAGDTYDSHAGWIESTAYTEATRVTWANGATASRSMTNSTTADFSMNATATIKGVSTKGDSTAGASNYLWSTAAFSVAASVTNGDTLKITYTING